MTSNTTPQGGHYIDNDRGSPIVHGLGAVRPEVGTFGQVDIARTQAVGERGET